ncbi:MAG: M56 family metallopeptidase, partial [Gemmatimonadetes bacterium]|nr:M56 family metallopeptidase [Gemmatimonadota bacterium]
MIAAWMLWSVGAGLMFLVAGLAAERLLKGGRRWVWLAAGIGTVALPAIRLLTTSPPSAGGAPPAVPILLDPLAVTVARDSALHSLDDLLLLGWVVLSALLLVGALIGGARFMRRRASWEPGTLLGRGVLWSRVTGPAVVGLFRSRVVLPSWVRGAGAERQELILAHEEEHLRARDVQLRFACGALLLAFPWNPALWLQYRRLNLAIELDCDRRVMNRLPEHRRLYGDLLLRVGSGHGALPGLAVAALAEQPSLLERRIRQLLKKAPEVKMAQAACLVFGALVVVGVALSIPGITGEGPAGLDGSEESEAGVADLSAGPRFTPYTVAPDRINDAEILRALEQEYPPLLRDAGIGGTVHVWFFIDERGVVRNQFVQESSGHQALDQAALRVAPIFRFTPALNRDRAVPVWVTFPIT